MISVQYKTFAVYQQRSPKVVNEYGHANLVRVGNVEAYSGKHALDLVRDWAIFKRGRKLGQWPVVEEIVKLH